MLNSIISLQTFPFASSRKILQEDGTTFLLAEKFHFG